jgi:hypothetical protein
MRGFSKQFSRFFIVISELDAGISGHEIVNEACGQMTGLSRLKTKKH